MTRLLVTGAGGVLGRALLPILPLDKYEVFAVTTNKAKFKMVDGVAPVENDLLRETSRRKLIEDIRPNVLIHLAWNQNDGFRQSDTNLEWLAASLDMLCVFRQCGGERFLFAGSSSEYDAVNGRFDENEGSAKTQYGICKRAFTETAGKFGEAFGIQVIVARYFTIYGPHDRHIFGAIPSAINSILRGERVSCKAPDTVRDYVFSSDAAAATVRLLESGITGVVNIATGKPRTMREVFSAIANQMDALESLDFANTLIAPDLLTADISRMQNELGYTCETSFEDGIRKTIDWWRAGNGL